MGDAGDEQPSATYAEKAATTLLGGAVVFGALALDFLLPQLRTATPPAP